jgi:hypothetical protein
MTIERTANEVIIRMSSDVNWESLEIMLRFIQYRERVSKSKAQQSDIDRLASEVNKNWWAENQHRFLKSE